MKKLVFKPLLKIKDFSILSKPIMVENFCSWLAIHVHHTTLSSLSRHADKETELIRHLHVRGAHSAQDEHVVLCNKEGSP